MEIQGKVAVVTGASAGIGLATARLFAAEGAHVVVAARSGERLAELVAELQQAGHPALAVTCDMRLETQVHAMIAQAFAWQGRLDILVNNAGQAAAGTVAALGIDDFRQVLELNVFGPLYAIQAAVPHMREGGGGLVVNVSSMVTKMVLPGLAAYSATKAALNMLSVTARAELAPDNIRVLTVFPRMTATDFGKHSLGNRALRERQRTSVPSHVVVDSAEHVAGKILEAVRKEPAEQYMDA